MNFDWISNYFVNTVKLVIVSRETQHKPSFNGKEVKINIFDASIIGISFNKSNLPLLRRNGSWH